MRWLPQTLRRVAKWAWATRPAGTVTPSPAALVAYAALGHWTPPGAAFEPRLELLVAQFAAERSGCRWCIEQGRHHWRRAFLPTNLLGSLQEYRVNPLYSDRDRAALALADAVVRYSSQDPAAAECALIPARQLFTEAEIARIIQIATREHFFNPATGALGLDTVDPATALPAIAASRRIAQSGRI